MTSPLRSRWLAAAALLREHNDLVEERPSPHAPSAALLGRGFHAYLLALPDDALAHVESEGAGARWPEGAPRALVELAAAAREVSDVPSWTRASQGALEARPRRHESMRKQAQIDAFAHLVDNVAAGAARVVDVGSGHGHLTRKLGQRLRMPVVGLERAPALVSRARALAGGAVAFAVTDVLQDGFPLSSTDCVVGLHACGELGDAMVTEAAAVSAAVALVGCCLQKRRSEERRSLVDPAFVIPRSALGLSNLTARDVGVEATREENLEARERRLALSHLLGDARSGEELAGLNRRTAHQDLGTLVARAFAVRGRSPPSAEDIERAARWAREAHGRLRRLALPRAMLARALEVFVLCDRALFLEERGYAVTIGALFPAAVSARNLALAAAR